MKKYKGKVAALVLAGIVTALMPAALHTVPVYGQTITETAGLSQDQIRTMWSGLNIHNEVEFDAVGAISSHTTGSISNKSQQEALEYLNFLRALAGLPAVKLDTSLSQRAQYGAVLLADLGHLSHYPSKPVGISDEFYEKAYEATSRSNLSKGYKNLIGSIQGQMNDISNETNLARVGHRRWLLYSKLGAVGFGAHDNYNSVWIADTSGSAEFDYIAWPAPGSFPTEVFGTNVPWSVTPNWNKYSYDSVNDLSVTVTSQSDGRSWTLNSNTVSPSPDMANGYFTVDISTNQGYVGDWDCIIFHMGENNLQESDFSGLFDVEVSGLKTKDGAAATLKYTIDFFAIKQ